MITSNGNPLDESPRRMGQLEPVPGDEYADRAALRRRMPRNGYFFLRGHLDPALVTGFRNFYFKEFRYTGLVDPNSPAFLGKDSGGEFDRAAMRSIVLDDTVLAPVYAALTTPPAIRD